MAKAGRPCVIPTFLGFSAETCLHMALSVLALHSILSEFSGHMGRKSLVDVQVHEAEDVATGLIPLLKTVDLSVFFDNELPQYQVLYRYLRPFVEPPAPKAFSAWEMTGESISSLVWRTLEETYNKTVLVKMLNTVFAILTFSDRKIRLEPRPVVRLNDDGYPQIEDGLSCLITFNIPRRLL